MGEQSVFFTMCDTGQHPSSEDAMVLEAGMPVDSAEIVEEDMVSARQNVKSMTTSL